MNIRLFIIAPLIFVIAFLAGCTKQSTHEPDLTSTPPPAESVLPEYLPGIISENKYQSSFLNLVYTLPSGWQFAATQQIHELAGSGRQLLENESGTGEQPASSTLPEFYAYDATGGESILFLVLEDLTAHEGGSLITAEMFVESLADQYKTITSVNYSIGESYSKTIGSIDVIVFPITDLDTGMYQRNYVFRIGNYMSTLTSTAQSANELDAIEENITALSQ